MALFCSRCGSELPGEAHFCSECGAQIELDPGHSKVTTVVPRDDGSEIAPTGRGGRSSSSALPSRSMLAPVLVLLVALSVFSATCAVYVLPVMRAPVLLRARTFEDAPGSAQPVARNPSRSNDAAEAAIAAATFEGYETYRGEYVGRGVGAWPCELECEEIGWDTATRAIRSRYEGRDGELASLARKSTEPILAAAELSPHRYAFRIYRVENGVRTFENRQNPYLVFYDGANWRVY